MGFMDRMREAAEAAQRAAQEQVDNIQRSQQGGGQPQPPQTVAQQPPAAGGLEPAAAQTGPGPAFPPAHPVQQGFTFERALSGQVGSADATFRRWPGSTWSSQYPNLGNDRFQAVLTIPAGTVGAGALELQITLDPFRPNGGYRTPGFDNVIVLRDSQTGRTWRAERQKSIGPIVVNEDGVSGTFRRFYLREDGQPDRSHFVILDGAWRAA